MKNWKKHYSVKVSLMDVGIDSVMNYLRHWIELYFYCIFPLDEVDPDLNLYHVIYQHMTANYGYLHEEELRDKTKLYTFQNMVYTCKITMYIFIIRYVYMHDTYVFMQDGYVYMIT